VTTPEDARVLFEETGCDAIMIGRATMKNPWIFRQIADAMAGKPVREATLAERRDLMLSHFSAIEDTAYDPKEALHKLRTMTGWYTNGLPHGRTLRIRISELQTPSDFRQAVAEFFRDLEQAA
jgi:tRNA-dihydrouridine synthase